MVALYGKSRRFNQIFTAAQPKGGWEKDETQSQAAERETWEEGK